jgi:hypothetical protein
MSEIGVVEISNVSSSQKNHIEAVRHVDNFARTLLSVVRQVILQTILRWSVSILWRECQR